jgi:hypothetical protein
MGHTWCGPAEQFGQPKNSLALEACGSKAKKILQDRTVQKTIVSVALY